MQKQFLDNTGLTELLEELGQYLKEVKADKTELPLIVHMDDTLQTCDTSIADIYTAYSVGRVVQMKIAGLSVPLSLVSSSSSSTAFAVTDKGTSLIVSGTNESGSDVWTIDSFVAQEKLTFDSTPTTGSQNPVTSNGIKTAIDRKQDALVSGTNIKTINNTSLLGSGNISIEPNQITSITTTESPASGGNNTVTINTTDGTSKTFNVKNGTDGKDGQDGVDGVSLGEVALMQTTGDSEESVMSQKAVTEYGRKVTAEDLDGTSEWIRAKLTEEGWEFGKYLYTNVIRDDAAYCVTPLIPINDIIGHSLTWDIGVIAKHIKLWYIDANGTRTGYVDGGTTSSSTRTITVASSGGSSAANATHLRISLSASNLPQCYIFDNTTGEYLLKVDEILSESCEDCNLPYGVFENTLLTQEEGDSSFKTMSQEAITKAIKHSRSLNPCQCAFIKGNTYFNLSDEQCAALNNTGIISIICTRLSAQNPSYPTEWRYFRLRGASAGNTTDGFYIGCASHGRMYYQTYANNTNNQAQADGANIYNGSKICPAVSVVVWDRINGIVKFYDRSTLITTKQDNAYKLTGFVGTNKYIYMFPGDNPSFLYDLQIYNYDIIGIVDTYINQLEGANYIHECYDGNLKKALSDWGDGGHSTYGNSTAIPYTYDGNTVIMTSTSSCVANSTTTNRGYYVGTTDVARLYESDIEVVSGECKINNCTPNIIEKIVDRDTGDVYSAEDTLGVGKYTICGRAMVVGCWSLTYMSGDPMVVKHTENRQKYISCVMHLKCDALYNGKLYDDQADIFYDTEVVPSNTAFKYIKQSTSAPPNFAGQMALSGNNVYVGNKNYTWKQINNS